MRYMVAIQPWFPLTLTLSLGERGQSEAAACFVHTGVADFAAPLARTRRTILPLPGGEGWGEGKEIVANPAVPSVKSTFIG